MAEKRPVAIERLWRVVDPMGLDIRSIPGTENGSADFFSRAQSQDHASDDFETLFPEAFYSATVPGVDYEARKQCTLPMVAAIMLTHGHGPENRWPRPKVVAETLGVSRDEAVKVIDTCPQCQQVKDTLKKKALDVHRSELGAHLGVRSTLRELRDADIDVPRQELQQWVNACEICAAFNGLSEGQQVFRLYLSSLSMFYKWI